MVVYAVAERRLRPGGWPEYLAALQEIDRYLVGKTHRGPYSLYVAEEEPDLVLGIGLWRERHDLADAAASLPRHLAERLLASVDGGGGCWEWFQSVRQRRALTGSTGVVAAARFEVPTELFPAFRAWTVEAQDRSIALGGVLTQHLLRCEDAPEVFVHLAEYTDHDARQRALTLIDHQLPPPVRLLGLRRFVGRIGHYWHRDEALGRHTRAS